MLRAIYLHLQCQTRKIISIQDYSISTQISTNNVYDDPISQIIYASDKGKK